MNLSNVHCVTLGGKKRKASGSFTFQRDFSPFSGCSRHMHYGRKFKISSKYYWDLFSFFSWDHLSFFPSPGALGYNNMTKVWPLIFFQPMTSHLWIFKWSAVIGWKKFRYRISPKKIVSAETIFGGSVRCGNFHIVSALWQFLTARSFLVVLGVT